MYGGSLDFIAGEARSLRARLDRVVPLSLIMPSVPAAGASKEALNAVDRHLARERFRLRRRVDAYLHWLAGEGRNAAPQAQQRRLTLLKLDFVTSLDQLDIFADALTQRSETGNGVWLAGLDRLADDALALPKVRFDPPPLVTYLDRGHGAAIRRARTRLPGGSPNPITVIRIPRERMVGSGIASSLVHEVGHQGAAILGLVDSLRRSIRERQMTGGAERPAWLLWERWISEIVADFWSIAKLGITATQGLIGVLTLPRAFVFRVALDDPHPFPWIRVKLSCAVGRILFPHNQWNTIEALWESMYPRDEESKPRQALIGLLESTLPDLAGLLAGHRPASLHGLALRRVFPVEERQPFRLRRLFERWRRDPSGAQAAAPTLVMAVLGQARFDRRLSPENETEFISRMLSYWAAQRFVGASASGTPIPLPTSAVQFA
jgi:hypothetical protein